MFGQEFQAISAGLLPQLNKAVSFIVKCDSQQDLDMYWQKLTADGGQEVACGWLKDKFGLSWQIIPVVLDEILQSNNPETLARVTQAFLKMKKFDIAALRRAYKASDQ